MTHPKNHVDDLEDQASERELIGLLTKRPLKSAASFSHPRSPLDNVLWRS